MEILYTTPDSDLPFKTNDSAFVVPDTGASASSETASIDSAKTVSIDSAKTVSIDSAKSGSIDSVKAIYVPQGQTSFVLNAVSPPKKSESLLAPIRYSNRWLVSLVVAAIGTVLFLCLLRLVESPCIGNNQDSLVGYKVCPTYVSRVGGIAFVLFLVTNLVLI